jgi:PAS domain S-box-containing protein
MGVHVSGQERVAPHENYQELYDLTPAAYVVTDPNGTILQANRRASRLLGTTGRFLGGRALSGFVDAGQRAAFRERIGRAGALESAEPWLLRVGARGGEPVTVAVAVTAARDDSGRTVALRWLLAELPPDGLAQQVSGDRPPGRGAMLATGLDLERLVNTLEEVALAAVSLLRADHVSVIAEDGGRAPASPCRPRRASGATPSWPRRGPSPPWSPRPSPPPGAPPERPDAEPAFQPGPAPPESRPAPEPLPHKS